MTHHCVLHASINSSQMKDGGTGETWPTLSPLSCSHLLSCLTWEDETQEVLGKSSWEDWGRSLWQEGSCKRKNRRNWAEGLKVEFRMQRNKRIGKILQDRRRTLIQSPAGHWWRVRAKHKRPEYRIDICQHREGKARQHEDGEEHQVSPSQS